MKLKGINNSSRKTKELIKKSFAELLEEKKETKNITVKELVERVDLTRGAFYSHYDNIYEVASEIQDEILDTIFNNNIVLNSKEDINKYIDSIFNYLKENEKIYSKLLVSDDPMIFMNRLNKKICETISQTLGNSVNHLDILLFTNGIINIIIQYFRKEIPEELSDICEYVKKISSYLFFKK